jgi:hypothetical protein
MSVLEGPAASALYSSRASNSVILIKTKSGKKQKGLGVEFSTNSTFETPLKLPEYQTVYVQGNGSGSAFAFVNGAGGGLTDGTDEGWRPAFNGQSYPQFNSPRTLNGQVTPFLGVDLNAPAGSIITSTPWVADKNNLKNFLQTGTTFTNNLAFVGGNNDGDFRLSYTNLNQVGMIPNTDGLEAWFDWKRTGLPEIIPGPDNLNNNLVPVRFIYPLSEQALNATNRAAAVQRQGPDNINTLTWVAK